MKAVQNAMQQAADDDKRELEQQKANDTQKAKHSGSDADRRVALIRNILNKSES